jgi:hypothetical protein
MTRLRQDSHLRQGSGGQAGGRGFEARVLAFADRFLSTRSFELIVAPALADLQFENELGRRSAAAGRCAVLRAVAGGLRQDFSRDSWSLVKLTLLPFCYYTAPLVMGLDYFTTWPEVAAAFGLVLALSLAPVLVCFWPSRHTTRPVD